MTLTTDQSATHTPTGAAAEFLAQPVDHLSNIPWPFPDELAEFSYSVNVEPARIPHRTRGGEWGRNLVDLGGAEYPSIMAERRRILDADPSRVRIRPGMEIACWDLLLYYLRDLALAYPQFMRLDELGAGRFHWRNDLLGTDAAFTLGDSDTLPGGPMEFLAREVPDDLLLVVERDGRLYFDAGVVTFAAAWSVSFDVGMDMYEIHAPVPGLIRDGIVARAEQFLRRLPADQVYRRVNWTLSASDSHKLDVVSKSFPSGDATSRPWCGTTTSAPRVCVSNSSISSACRCQGPSPSTSARSWRRSTRCDESPSGRLSWPR